MAEVIDAVDDFVLSLDSLIRVGGVAPVESDEVDDYEKIAKAKPHVEQMPSSLSKA